MIEERHVLEELRNIVENEPVWPGNTVSHATADECGRRGWAARDAKGFWIATVAGLRRAGELVAPS